MKKKNKNTPNAKKIICENCSQDFFRWPSEFKKTENLKYCSNTCKKEHTKQIFHNVECLNCLKFFQKSLKELQKTPNSFCSRSCAATYNNTHKTKGCRRSKLEIWLESKLTELYPNLEVHYSRKDAINSELDIYVPSLKIGFEINGIFHYEPIYGSEKLQQIQNNDNKKLQSCLNQDIDLFIIDISNQKIFKESTSYQFLEKITDSINEKTLEIQN